MKQSPKSEKGRIVFVGTGLKAISHMTLEAVAEIESADRVFYHAADGVTASFIRSLNPRSHDLYQYYGTGKRRNVTYLQMAEAMLTAVREGESVCGVYYGHPGVFVKAVRRVLYQARQEGHEALMYPGITTMDYLFADLEVDPSRNGCTIVDANDYYLRKRPLDTTSQVIVLQVGAFADGTFDFSGYEKAKFPLLINALLQDYGGDTPCVLYRGSNFPGIESQQVSLNLSDLLDPDTVRRHVTGVSTLYIPPKELREAEADRVKEAGYGRAGATSPLGPTRWETANTEKMKKVAENLPYHQLPEGYVQRKASGPMLDLMHTLATDPSTLREFKSAPQSVVEAQPLSTLEKRALLSGSISRVAYAAKADGSSPPTANGFLNSLLQNGTTADLHNTYYTALSQGNTDDQATAAVQNYINNAGYSGVTVQNVEDAITTVAGGSYDSVADASNNGSNVTYPPFGTTPSILYGTYQTFDSAGNPSLLIKLYSNNGTWQLQVATPTSKALVDITAGSAFQNQSGAFIVTPTGSFTYTGSIKFASCVVSRNGVDTTDFDVSVSLTSGTDPAITSTGRRSVWSSKAALQPATVDDPSLWAGTYTATVTASDGSKSSATLVVSSDGSQITYQGTTAAATFNPFYSTFQATIGSDTLILYVQWAYFQIYSANTYTGPNFYGYYYSGTKPSSPNINGILGSSPPPDPGSDESAARKWEQIGIQVGVGVAILVVFEVMKFLVKKGYAWASEKFNNANENGNDLDENPNNEDVPEDEANQFNDEDDPHGDDDDNDDNNDDDNNDDDNNDDDNNDDDNNDDDNNNDDDSSCFLTTAVVGSLGLPDDSEPLKLARYLRDVRMRSGGDRASVELYYKVAPTIVDRSTDAEWHQFWVRHLRPITALIKQGEFDLAKELYTIATADLVDKKATRFRDADLVDEVYAYGLGALRKFPLPYPLRYLALKAAFKVCLPYHKLRLWLRKREVGRRTDI